MHAFVLNLLPKHYNFELVVCISLNNCRILILFYFFYIVPIISHCHNRMLLPVTILMRVFVTHYRWMLSKGTELRSTFRSHRSLLNFTSMVPAMVDEEDQQAMDPAAVSCRSRAGLMPTRQ
jgi:hypothetical protein